MWDFQRPALPALTFRDVSGAVIDYGNRWGLGNMAPQEMYSVTLHPERFAPIHTLADALLAYLISTYEVTVADDPETAAEFEGRRVPVQRAVRLIPARPDAAPMTLVFTRFPGVIIRAGLLQDFLFPNCGCDACDEPFDYLAEEMEEDVRTVVEGRLQEFVNDNDPQAPGQGGWSAWPGPSSNVKEPILEFPSGFRIAYRITAPDGSPRGRGERVAGPYQTARIPAAKAFLEGLANGWQPWPHRQTR